MSLLADVPIIQEGWDKTPLSVQAVVLVLWDENQVLKQQVAHLQVEMGKLREQANKSSQNSFKPPSSDMFSKRKQAGRSKAGIKGKGGS